MQQTERRCHYARRKHQEDNNAASRRRRGSPAQQHWLTAKLQTRGNAVTKLSHFKLSLGRLQDDKVVPCPKGMETANSVNDFAPDMPSTNVSVRFARGALVNKSLQQRGEMSRNCREQSKNTCLATKGNGIRK